MNAMGLYIQFLLRPQPGLNSVSQIGKIFIFMKPIWKLNPTQWHLAKCKIEQH